MTPASRTRARSPGSSSPTAARSSPGRTPRCSSPTSGPTWSRSSRPRATRPAAGGRPGSGEGDGADGRLLPGRQPQQAVAAPGPQGRGRPRGPPPAAGPVRRPGREPSRRRLRPARLRRRGARSAQPAARPPRDLGLRADRPGGGDARLRLHRPGRVRPDVDHRLPRRATAASRRRSASRSPT